MPWLKIVPLWAWVVLVAAIAVGAQQIRIASLQTEVSAVSLELSGYRYEVSEQRRLAEAQARAEEQRMQKVADDAGKAARTQIESAKADAADANSVALRMLKQADKLARFAGDPSCQPGAANDRATTTAAALVLTDVLGRVDGVAGELAAAYDHARIAGLACESITARTKP